jgi:hypothetical protein
MPPVIDNFAFKYGDDGVVINAMNSTAPYLDIKSVEGLDNAPFKITTHEYDGRDGGSFQGEFEGMRKIVISGEIHGGDVVSNPLEVLLDSLKANFAPTTVAKPLYFYPFGVAMRQVFCKSEGFRYSWDAMRRWNSSPFSITLTAEDPTIYSATQKTETGVLITSSPGYVFNHGFDYSFGGMGSVGTPLITNSGNKPVGFYATWSGQGVSNPRLISATDGGKIFSLDLDLSISDTLVVDFYREKVLLNGQSRRKAVMEEGWFQLLPGANQLSYQADSTAASSVLISYWDGYR